MNGEGVLAVLSMVLSVALEVAPGLRTWWEGWSWKRLAWLAGCAVVPVAWMGLAYAGAPVGIVPPEGPFVWDGLWAALQAGAVAYFASQAVYVPFAGGGHAGPPVQDGDVVGLLAQAFLAEYPGRCTQEEAEARGRRGLLYLMTADRWGSDLDVNEHT